MGLRCAAGAVGRPSAARSTACRDQWRTADRVKPRVQPAAVILGNLAPPMHSGPIRLIRKSNAVYFPQVPALQTDSLSQDASWDTAEPVDDRAARLRPHHRAWRSHNLSPSVGTRLVHRRPWPVVREAASASYIDANTCITGPYEQPMLRSLASRSARPRRLLRSL